VKKKKVGKKKTKTNEKAFPYKRNAINFYPLSGPLMQASVWARKRFSAFCLLENFL
jgi:hypothetical protein